MLVFVYGTLTDPDRVEVLLGDGPGEYELGSDAILEGLHRVDGRYPTLAPGGSVEGRLLAVDEPALERLDRYEGVDRGLYTRVAVSHTDRQSVWVYVGEPERLHIEAETSWPDEPSFREAVRSHLERAAVEIRPSE
nr:gamma-glutamylcyclotransferase family protein [Natronorubrum thiooxidans]